MKRSKSASIIPLVLSLMVLFTCVFSTSALAAVGDTPAHTKNLTDNQDGTYTLSLDVVGESEKKPNNINVIVIFDRSGSMNNTRMTAAKNAVNSLANSLFAYNTTSEPDTVEMALVTFSNVAEVAQSPTNSASTFRGAVNAASANGGTNWEAALQTGAGIDFGDSDQTFAIFVSDGNPTFRFTEGNYPNHNNDYNWQYNNAYGVWGTGSDDDATTVARCYEHAVDDAQALANKVGTGNFFTIGAFGSVDRMQSLTRAAGAPSSNYYSASDTGALNQAIADILLKEGYVQAVDVVTEGSFNTIRITLKYGADKNEKVIKGLKRISKPGLRVYSDAENLPKVLGGLGTAIISTNKGVLTDKEARKENVGGEVLAFVW